MNPNVDLFVIFHNSREQLPAFFAGIRKLTIPVTAYFLDNNSTDGTPDILAERIYELPFRVHLLRSSRNNGFARGMNMMSRHSRGEFIFLLNPDTELEPGCLEQLVQRAGADPQIAICEGRQAPREHHKTYDPETGETSWCSGAAALIRRTAFEQVGGFDDRLYFMYCEDVDLSWRLWLSGWKCVYVPGAVVQHFTQDLVPGKRRTRENYFSFRNTLFLYHRFAQARDRPLLAQFLLKRFTTSRYSFRSKVLFAIALVDHIRYIPYLLQTRAQWGNRSHPWIRLKETSLSD